MHDGTIIIVYQCWRLFQMFCLTIWRAINKIKTAAESSCRAALKRENEKIMWDERIWAITQNCSIKTFHISRQTAFTWLTDLNADMETENEKWKKKKQQSSEHIYKLEWKEGKKKKWFVIKVQGLKHQLRGHLPHIHSTDVSVVYQLGHSDARTVLVFVSVRGRVAFVRYRACGCGSGLHSGGVARCFDRRLWAGLRLCLLLRCCGWKRANIHMRKDTFYAR